MSRKKRSRLCAFTIIELLTVLAISAIVLSFSFAAYRFVNSYISTIERKSNQYSELSLIFFSLKNDLIDFNSYKINKGELIIFKLSDTITYTSNDQMLIRESKKNEDELFNILMSMDGKKPSLITLTSGGYKKSIQLPTSHVIQILLNLE